MPFAVRLVHLQFCIVHRRHSQLQCICRKPSNRWHIYILFCDTFDCNALHNEWFSVYVTYTVQRGQLYRSNENCAVRIPYLMHSITFSEQQEAAWVDDTANLKQNIKTKKGTEKWNTQASPCASHSQQSAWSNYYYLFDVMWGDVRWCDAMWGDVMRCDRCKSLVNRPLRWNTKNQTKNMNRRCSSTRNGGNRSHRMSHVNAFSGAVDESGMELHRNVGHPWTIQKTP